MCHNDIVTKIEANRVLVRSLSEKGEQKVLLVCVNNSTKLFSVDILIHLLNCYGIRGLSGLSSCC